MAERLGADTGGTKASGDLSPGRLALILLAILAVRLIALWLNRTDLFFDEAQYWTWAQEPALGYYSKPPLIAWVIAATTAVCGDGEPCVRLGAPILHTVTAWVIYLIGCRLYDARVGLWSGIVYATLPGVSVSTGIISTDVPFLLCWALALLGFVRLRQSNGMGDALLLGAAIGAGFLARYGMAFFVGSMLVALFVIRGGALRIGAARWLVVAGFTLLVASPNLYWNIVNGFATFGHTADNAKWGGSLFHPLKALEFFVAQFGVFGPVLFGVLLVIVYRALVAHRHKLAPGVGSDPHQALGTHPPGGRKEGSDADRLLLCFVLPILVIYIGQAFVSRAHANWAAAGYVAATVLVTATMLREGARRWFRASLGFHVAVAAIIALAPATAGTVSLPFDPFRRLLGWREMADRVRSEVQKAASEGKPYAAILADDRATVAELIYYLRDLDVPVRAWKSGPIPRDHYQMTRPYQGQSPVLLINLTHGRSRIIPRFKKGEERLARARSQQVPNWAPLYLYRLEDFKK